MRSAPKPSRLETAVQFPKRAQEAATALGLQTAGDLLEYFPRAHADRRDVRPIAALGVGEKATIAAVIRSIKIRPTRNRRVKIVEATVADESGPIAAVWFNQPWLASKLPEGTRVLLHGEVRRRNQFTVAEYEVADDAAAGVHTVGFVPVYAATKGITPQMVRQQTDAIRALVHDTVEPLPALLRAKRRLPDRAAALAAAHFPEDEEEHEQARVRLAFEELLMLELEVARRKRHRQEGGRARPLEAAGEMVDPWLEQLPFTLTGDQQRAVERIDHDIARDRPMQRLLMGDVGTGKAQPLDARVLTPRGFRPMGEINVGDEVINPTGRTTRVLGVFPQGEREVWRVGFSDGSTVECDADHLWAVRTSSARWATEPAKVMTAREIRADLLASNGGAKWHVELPLPADLDDGGQRPLDPYVLGLLLGGGCSTAPDQVRFTSADPEIVGALCAGLPEGCALRKSESRPHDWKIVGASTGARLDALSCVRRDRVPSLVAAHAAGASCGTIATRAEMTEGTARRRLISAGEHLRRASKPRNPLEVALSALGLLGRSAHDKAVPPQYLNASVPDRIALLQGLMDADGTIDRRTSSTSFSSVSRRLADDVVWLARSLGGRARLRSEVRDGRVYWWATLNIPGVVPFRLQRKAELHGRKQKHGNPAKAIVSIEPSGRKPMQCIAVEHPNRLYITDDFTVTHNTAVSLHAMLRALENGRQAALMAPTETLAEQHLLTLDRLLGGLVPIGLLTGSTPAARRRELLARLASGELNLVVGTHALLEPAVAFRDLALYVIDEQHRFGVRQRAALDRKAPEGLVPHALHMTATPIPRTLALTAYGDLDATTLRELPAGRGAVETYVVDGERAHARAYERAREEIGQGRQCFVVCPLVTESEVLQAKAAVDEAERLQATEFKDHRVQLIHGQMPAQQKQEAMRAFAAGAADVLVATSVIEVGIDVPNATVMLIEEAERYGISQLHQLRGRIGRGKHPGLCILFGSPQNPRLAAVAAQRDGFALAEIDLELRGAGEVLGTRQHGLPEWGVARLPEDADLLQAARDTAEELLNSDPELAQPEHTLLRDVAAARFGADLDPIPA